MKLNFAIFVNSYYSNSLPYVFDDYFENDMNDITFDLKEKLDFKSDNSNVNSNLLIIVFIKCNLSLRLFLSLLIQRVSNHCDDLPTTRSYFVELKSR